jgi:hypothetical protein
LLGNHPGRDEAGNERDNEKNKKSGYGCNWFGYKDTITKREIDRISFKVANEKDINKDDTDQ